jgi:hypothetical protein
MSDSQVLNMDSAPSVHYKTELSFVNLKINSTKFCWKVCVM